MSLKCNSLSISNKMSIECESCGAVFVLELIHSSYLVELYQKGDMYCPACGIKSGDRKESAEVALSPARIDVSQDEFDKALYQSVDLIKRGKPILCLDFDGVLHTYPGGWQGADVIAGVPVPGAIDFLYRAISEFTVCIFSSRSSLPGGIEAMKKWLWGYEDQWRKEQVANGIPVPRICLALNLHWPNFKPAAYVTLDDRAITFNGDWPDINELLNFETWQGSEV